MAILRTDIERALDELISNEEGMRFQALAVVLAKQKWPDLIASERHRDGGLDAYAPASVAEDKKAKGVASSITGTITKIKDDATNIKKNFPDVEILIFATPRKVTNPTIQGWAGEIRTEFGYELVVMTREDIITSLVMPSNAPLCRTLLAINVPGEATEAELLTKMREAVAEEAQNWRAQPRTANRPIVSLQAVRLDSAGKETSDTLDTASIRASLAQARRIALEAPGGGGKTTTLVQLATQTQPQGELSFLIDLPALGSAARPAFINRAASRTTTYWIGDRMTPSTNFDFTDFTVAETTARECYRVAEISDPLKQIQVTEFYDPYSNMTPLHLERLGFCASGMALRLERDGYWNVEGGAVAVNPSGGTLCTNPIAVTGLVRAIDAANQVMGKAGAMQVPNVRNALSSAVGGIAQFFNCTVFGDEPRGH
jgi:hypothetical protein